MKHTYLKGVATLELSYETCVGCGMCAQVCPHRVFSLSDGKARIRDRDDCMECGACALNCPVGAISVEANVGCAAAIIKGWLTGTEPHCDCSGDDSCCG